MRSIPYEPHDYQKRGTTFLIQTPGAGLFLDPGLGKTSMTLHAHLILREAKIIQRTLVIAPMRVMHSVWPGEQAKWTDFKSIKMAVLHGTGKGAKLWDPTVQMHVINPEGLPWLIEELKGRKFPWQMLVVDESTRFKHANTKRFKLLKKILPKFDRRVILTGSPAPNGLLDLFGQIYILDGGAALGEFITHYRMNYFDNPDQQGWKWVPRRNAPELIYKKLSPLVVRMSAEEYLKLPELIMNRVEVALPSSAMKTYKQMEELLITQVQADTIIAANAAAATSKCRQIANGGIYHEGGTEWTDIHEAKLDATEDLIEELQGSPALVAYEFQHDLERLRKRFGADTPYIGGGVPAARFREIERAWNAGDIPILLAQPQSVAHGLNLQGTKAAVIWHSLTWNLEDYEQFIRRVWRQGQTERVVVHHIVAKDTIDEAIMMMLKTKDRTQKALLNALRDYARERRVR
jgi:SNF2 family DNA or RNA helicase